MTNNDWSKFFFTIFSQLWLLAAFVTSSYCQKALPAFHGKSKALFGFPTNVLTYDKVVAILVLLYLLNE